MLFGSRKTASDGRGENLSRGKIIAEIVRLPLPEHRDRPGWQLQDAAPSGRLRRRLDDEAASAEPENCSTDFHRALVQVQIAPLHGERFADPQASRSQEEYKIWKITFHRLLIGTQPLVEAPQLLDGQ